MSWAESGRRTLATAAAIVLATAVALPGCQPQDLGSLAKMDLREVVEVKITPSWVVRQAAMSRTETTPCRIIESRDAVAGFVGAVRLARRVGRVARKPNPDYYAIWMMSDRGRSYGLGYWEGEELLIDLHTFFSYRISPELAEFIRSTQDCRVWKAPNKLEAPDGRCCVRSGQPVGSGEVGVEV